MNNFLLTILLLSTSIGFSQEILHGKYSTDIKETSFMNESITFKKNGKFNLIQFHCTGKTTGTGNYKLSGDSLKLIFNNPETKRSNQKKMASKIEYKPILNDKENSSIIIADLRDNTRLPFVNIISIDSLLPDDSLSVTTTDFDGRAKLNTEKGNTLIIKYLGYEEVSLPYSIIKNKNVNVSLSGIECCSFYLTDKDNTSMPIKIINKSTMLIDRQVNGTFFTYSK